MTCLCPVILAEGKSIAFAVRVDRIPNEIHCSSWRFDPNPKPERDFVVGTGMSVPTEISAKF